MTLEADARIVTQQASPEAAFPLTSGQMRIWLDELFFPHKPIANTGMLVTLSGPLDPRMFSEAIRRLVQETEAFRLRLRMEHQEVCQEVLELSNYAIEQLDFSGLSDADAAVHQWIEEHFWTSIDWNAFPLFQFALIKVRHDRHLWVQKNNHLIIDGIGRHLAIRRVAEIYEAIRTHAVPPRSEGVSMVEVVEAEERYRRSDQYRADRDHWLRRFATLPDPIVQRDRRETERTRSGRFTRLSYELSRQEFERLETLARSLGSSGPRALLAFVYIAFRRLYGTNDFTLGSTVHNRLNEKLKRTICLLSGALPLRIDLDAKVSFADVLRQVDTILMQDRRHGRFPMDELASMLQLARQGRNLNDVLVNYIPAPPPIEFGGAATEISNLSHGFFLPWAITVSHHGKQSGVRLTVDYDSGLIDADEARRLGKCLRLLLTQGVPDVQQPIDSLPLIDDDERRRLIVDLNRTAAPVPADVTLTQLCAEQARRTPRAIAATCGTEQIDFAALHAKAENLAARLVAMGVGPEVVVGIALPRTIDLLVAVLAIHKAGGAYLPLDPAYPAERLQYMVSDARAPIIISTSALAATSSETSARLLLLDRLDGEMPPGSSPLPQAQPHNLAYVIYTSGSTGRPKGVCVEHRTAVNFLASMRPLLDDDELGGMLFSCSLNFDPSVFEMFLPLIYGGRMILVDSVVDVPKAPARDEVRIINTVPSLIDVLLKLGTCPKNVRTIGLVGEPLTRSLADRIFATLPDGKLINFYGPTEITVYSNWSRVERADRRPPAIGKPIWNTQLYVADANLNLLPEGATGELYIGGAGVSRGYMGRPELTQERFLNNPFGEGRIYKSGDLVRWRADGELDYVGRSDFQVKVYGQRVELGEIEAQLEWLPGIAAAAVVARADKFGGNAIHAYAIAKDPQSAPKVDDLIAQLARVLPRHMLPSTLTWMDSFPLTPSGKLDRRALPASDAAAARTAYRAPSDDHERKLAAIWEETLQIDRAGVDDDFYELGGTSLQAFMIFSKVAAMAGVELTSATMMHASTIAQQADILRRALTFDGVSDDPGNGLGKLVPFRRVGSKAPLFFVHGAWGGIMFVREIERHLKSDRPVLGLQPPPLDGSTVLPGTVESIAADYIAEIRKQQPNGPYFLAGYSFGVWVVYEMAQQLVRAGERVAFLGMIDSSIPTETKIQRHMREVRRESSVRARLASLGRRARTAVRYVKNLTGDTARQFPNRVRIRLGLPVPHAQHHDYYRHISGQAMRQYSPQPYPGHVVMFSDTEKLEFHYSRWQTLVRGGVTMRGVRAQHHEIVWPPYSEFLAEAFDSVIDIGS